jgi:hypothetical protein
MHLKRNRKWKTEKLEKQNLMPEESNAIKVSFLGH